jgi:hypothetical protein
MATYKTYSPEVDFKVAFKTNPLTTGIASTDLKFSYYAISTPGTIVPITGSFAEQNGTYITPAINIADEGDYIVVAEYSKDGGTTFKKIAESNVCVGVMSASAAPAELSFGAII